MPIVDNSEVAKFSLPGLVHQTIAGHEHGVKSMEVWMQTIAPHAETPVHRHACEEIIVILRGCGRVTIDGQDADFGPDTTLIVPPDVVHQIVNTGDEEMFLIAALGTAPVRVSTADGQPLPLPWQAP